MDWLPEVLGSEFLWGTVLGVLLSAFAARLAIYFQTKHQTETVGAFALDLVASIQDHVRSLEDHRERNRLIHNDFLSFIDAEVGVWGRNREHMILIRDKDTRRRLREFFATTATYVVKIRWQLEQFSQETLASRGADGSDFQSHADRANGHLAEAHRLCERLATFVFGQEGLEAPLARIASGRKSP